MLKLIDLIQNVKELEVLMTPLTTPQTYNEFLTYASFLTFIFWFVLKFALVRYVYVYVKERF